MRAINLKYRVSKDILWELQAFPLFPGIPGEGSSVNLVTSGGEDGDTFIDLTGARKLHDWLGRFIKKAESCKESTRG